MSRTLFTPVLFGLVVISLGHCMENFPFPDYGFHHHGLDHSFGHSSYEDYDHHFDHNNDHDHKYPAVRVKIDKIKRKYSTAKSFLRKSCKQNTNIGAKILYGTDDFIIKYPIPNINNLNITVKAVNGLIVTEVKEQGGNRFQDVRVLPEMLNLQNGFWTIEHSNLKILLPYQVSSAELNTVCEAEDSEVNIPPGNKSPAFDLRFGKINP